jgi:DNA-binding NarL/FixJ family response regulator
MTRLLIIDDHAVVRQGLVQAFKDNGFASIETAASLAEARSKVAAFNPEAIIVDLNLPDGSGLEIVQWVRKHSAKIAIIILSLNDPAQFIKVARSSGANAYLSKSQSMQEIISSVTFALSNPGSFTSALTSDQHRDFDLTPREIEVLHLLAEGASNSDISGQLYVSISTVKTHISSVMRKLQCTNRTAAARIARENGFLL